MSLKDALSKKLTPELLTQVTDALGDEFDYDMVPRSRLNKVIKQRNDLKATLEEGAKDPDVDKTDDDDDSADGTKDLKTPAKGITEKELAKILAEKETANTKALQDLKIQYAALDELRAAKAIDPDLVLKSGVIDMSKIAFDDAGKLTGLSDQIPELVKSKGFLFGKGEAPTGTGREDDDGGSGGSSELDAGLAEVFGGYGITPIK